MKIKHRWMAWMVALAMCSVAVACDDGEDGMDAGGDEVDAGGDDGTDAGDMDAGGGVDAGDTDAGDTDAGDTDAGDTDAGGDVDAGPVEPSLSAENQTLTLSTVVTVAEASSDGPGWVVIHEDDGGNPGDIIGAGLLASGAQTNIEVALDRPAENNEPLHAMLHIDADELGTFDSSTDTPVLVDDAPLTVSFLVTVPEGTPDIRLMLSATGGTPGPLWNFTAAEPARYADTIGEEPSNQTLHLRNDWRYEIVNAGGAAHPFEFIRAGIAGDDVRLSQGAPVGSSEGDDSIAWSDESSTLRFTVSFTFRTVAINEYLCRNHPGAMRGSVEYMAP